jgi:Tfp pilus assembly protein PilF
MHARAIVVALLIATPTLAGDAKSWVGKSVILIGYNVTIVNGKTDGNGGLVPAATLTKLQYDVEDEEGDYIKVHEKGIPGWFPKAQAVPLEEAVDYFTKAIEQNPQAVHYYHKRAEVFLIKEKYDLALNDYDEALKIMPGERSLLNNRGRVHFAMKDYDAAIIDFDAAIAADPKYIYSYCNRANSYTKKKNYERAVKDYDEALKMQPDLPNANNDLAWLRATCPDAKYRDGKLALEKATKACESTKWTDGVLLDTMAAACAEVGKFDEALKWQKKALEDKQVARVYGKEMRERIKLYEQKKPYRQDESAPSTTPARPAPSSNIPVG